jgi:hypothetical protein
MSPREIRIATRKSALALWQAEYVKARLQEAHPGLIVTLVPMVSRGDKLLDSPLSKIGGKGLFVKELETALLENEADIRGWDCSASASGKIRATRSFPIPSPASTNCLPAASSAPPVCVVRLNCWRVGPI